MKSETLGMALILLIALLFFFGSVVPKLQESLDKAVKVDVQQSVAFKRQR